MNRNYHTHSRHMQPLSYEDAAHSKSTRFRF